MALPDEAEPGPTDADPSTAAPAATLTPIPSSREAAYAAVLNWLRLNANLSATAEAAASRAAKAYHEPLPLALNRLGVVTDTDLQSAMIAVSGAPAAASEPDPDALGELSLSFLKAHRALPLRSEDERFALGVVDPFDEDVLQGVMFATGRDVSLSILRAGEQRRWFTSLFEPQETGWALEVTQTDETRLEAALEFDRDAPVARRVASWLTAAVERRASDVHIEPRGDALIVRFRIDGQLETIAEEPLAAAASVLARIKVLADLDLGERRTAQDGRTSIVVAGRPIDLRVSIVPSVNGEAAVLRILDRAEVQLTFASLGFSENERGLLERAVSWPHGLFLVTGPTGSGKTTTLYACLEAMRETRRKILSIEDPVEFYFDHVTQVQYAPKAGVTFPSAIRAFLRQDPDVILVGEIRDGDTARAAVQAALTGHLVLATLHTIDAERAIPRLIDMGVESFQLAACFKGVIAQRLVRRTCAQCRPPALTSATEEAVSSFAAKLLAQRRQGCSTCHDVGFVGRLAIAEGFEADEHVLDAIRNGRFGGEMARQVMASDLAQDGAAKVRAGLTTSAEIARALSS